MADRRQCGTCRKWFDPEKYDSGASNYFFCSMACSAVRRALLDATPKGPAQ